tara:strand:+ start:2623 stop:3150 length:528 start_codon:yes stop_codon:yes gene_type:complete
MTILTTLSTLDISNNIVDTSENIIVWYNGTKIKYYHRYEQVSTDIETISGVISIKLLNDTNLKITTSSKVRELILTRPGTTNTYSITLDSNYDLTNDPLKTWTLSLTDYGILTDAMSSTVSDTATAVASAINNLTGFSATANNNIITYTNTGSQIVQTSSIDFTLSVANGGGQFN